MNSGRRGVPKTEIELKDIRDDFVRDIKWMFKDKTELSDIYQSILVNSDLIQWLRPTLDLSLIHI